MADPRYAVLAENLVKYSCELQPGEKVLIDSIDCPTPMVRALIRAAAAAGAHPVLQLHSHVLWRDLMLCASEEQMKAIGEAEAHLMKEVQAYIAVRANPNVSDWADVPDEKMQIYRRYVWEVVHMDVRVPKTRWVILRWPSPNMAQQAQMPTEAFEDFYFDVCNMDYARMSRAMQPLRELMEATDKVRLAAPGTDLTFSIRGIPAIACDGKQNIPDGEVFTAPTKTSAEGTISFNSPTIYEGTTHENVRLTFREGKIAEAVSSNQEHLDAVLSTDEGACYLGEFAIGFNPYVTKPMKDILFDEKIAGSIHLTPGACYDDASNGNRSRIHWDLVLRMTEDAGGGEIYFDDRLIRKDGLFVVPELLALNPENLL